MILLLKVRPLLGVLAVAYALRRKYPARPARRATGYEMTSAEFLDWTGHFSRG